MAENKPGDGSSSPFGNGDGATSGGASKGGRDFVANPSGSGGQPSNGGHDFVATPDGDAAGKGPMPEDFPGQTPMKQPSAQPSARVCPDSIPSGGMMPFKGESQATSRTPFKVSTPAVKQPPANPDTPHPDK